MPSTTNKKNEHTNGADTLFDALNPGKMVSNAQRVLSAAVDVLEEEIAAGILAAKKIETKIFDVEDMREDPRDLMNRIRRDVHDAVDLLMDSLTAITRQLGDLTPKADAVKKESEKQDAKTEASIPVIRNIKPAKPGETTLLKLSMTNTGPTSNETIRLQKADLTGPQAFKIAAANISVKTPAVSLSPGEETELLIRVKIPREVIAGQYSGLFVDAVDTSRKAIILVDVA